LYTKYFAIIASYVGQTKRYLKTRINEHVKNIKAEESKLSVVSNTCWNVTILSIKKMLKS